MKFETLKELVKKRIGYKYLSKDGLSPYQNYKYILEEGKVFKTSHLDTDETKNCSCGWNLATLEWIEVGERKLPTTSILNGKSIDKLSN